MREDLTSFLAVDGRFLVLNVVLIVVLLTVVVAVVAVVAAVAVVVVFVSVVNVVSWSCCGKKKMCLPPRSPPPTLPPR